MKRRLLLFALIGCAGPLEGVQLETIDESSRRALLTLTLPSLDHMAAVMRAWRGAPTSLPALLLRPYGLPAASMAAVASDRPIGLAVVRADLPGSHDSVPEMCNAVAFTVRDPEGVVHWLDGYGTVVDHHGDFYRLEKQDFAVIDHDQVTRPLTTVTSKLWAWAHGNEVILSGSRPGLLMAGPAARAAAVPGQVAAVMHVYPQVAAGVERQAVAQSLAAAIAYLSRGRATAKSDRAAGLLSTASALFYMGPLDRAARADVTLRLGPAGAEVHAQTTPLDGVREPGSLPPVLDLALAGDGPVAALGALDCRSRLFGRQRTFIAAWKATTGADPAPLEQLVAAEEAALDGTCSFAVHADDELWSETASYPLRAGAAPEALNTALLSAIRSGDLPSLLSAADDLTTAKLLFEKRDDGVLAVDRVLGATSSFATRHAAALYGGATLHDRYVVRADRLLTVSGAHADERLARIAGVNAALPPDLSRALASGRGQAGFLFLDLAALWKPFLKAGQVIQSPLAALVAKNPTLIEKTRPLVITLEPSAGVDATATMPPETFQFLIAASVLLFGG